LFKVGVVPFHTWSPDAYTGAPAAVTGFMGSVVKVGGFAALGGIWLGALSALSGGPTGVLPFNATVAINAAAAAALKPLAVLFLVLALVSVLVGNFSALRQTSVRRLVAYSSVAHAGYMLFSLALPLLSDREGASLNLGSLWYYAVGYALATAGALTAIAALSGRHDEGDQLHLLAGQGRAQPFQGLVLTVFVASFAGLPPTVGFLGKFLVFGDLVARGHIAWAIVAMLAAVVGAAFYLRLLVSLWAPAGKEAVVAGDSHLTRWTVAAAAVAVVALMLWPNALTAPAVTAAVAH
jgi:NADH-quinone oxidoreductase subunit N